MLKQITNFGGARRIGKQRMCRPLNHAFRIRRTKLPTASDEQRSLICIVRCHQWPRVGRSRGHGGHILALQNKTDIYPSRIHRSESDFKTIKKAFPVWQQQNSGLPFHINQSFRCVFVSHQPRCLLQKRRVAEVVENKQRCQTAKVVKPGR